MMKRIMIGLALFLATIDSAHGTIPPDEVRATRLIESITVDGILSEQVWQNEYGVSNFRQRDPIEGAEPSQKTVVRLAYGDDALYVGARMYDSAPDSIIARLGRRDTYESSDAFSFFIDPYHDRRSGFYFAVSAAGTLLDGVLLNDDWDDDSWDGVWDGKVNIDAQGWTAEMRIPFSQLRFHKKDRYVWGVNFRRDIQRNNEVLFLVYTPKDESGFVSRFPDLVGIENIEPTRNIEVLPYVRTKAEYTNPSPGNPFNDGSRYLPATGADVKVGIGHNLTLNATINPDFGQVEVDPAVVNLTDVETFYSEKRPFFIEGASIFEFGYGGASSFYSLNWSNPDFFYSRRIGRAPQCNLPDHDFADVPEGTRIVGAGKLSGKIGNNWNIGTLHAITARENAELDLAGQRATAEAEPLTYYGVFRGLKEFDEARHGLGMISTVVARRFDDNRLRDELNSEAFGAGLDGWTFFDSEKTWVITGWAGMTHIRGNPTRMLAVQRNSQHYFQRPDADHVEVDSSATSLTGYAGRFWINKQKGNTIVNVALGLIDPGYDVNDIGYVRRGDYINGHVILGYQWTKPGQLTRHAEFHLATYSSWDFGGNRTRSGLFHLGSVKLLNYYSATWYVVYNPQTINTTRTRGGPLTLDPAGWETYFSMNTDDRKKWVIEVEGLLGDYGSADYWSINPNLVWKPAGNVSLSIGPEFVDDHTHAQWVGAFDDPLATATFGRKYVFAELKQKTLAASIRLNWTFTPKLSFQLYAQPLVSSGDYYDFKELARPRTYDFIRYGDGASTFSAETYEADPDGDGPAEPIELGNPDFNFKSLRGNAVLRWEYLPGSTLYLVWTQRRFDFENIGEFRFNRSIDRLLHADADNIFMIKISYWWGL